MGGLVPVFSGPPGSIPFDWLSWSFVLFRTTTFSLFWTALLPLKSLLVSYIVSSCPFSLLLPLLPVQYYQFSSLVSPAASLHFTILLAVHVCVVAFALSALWSQWLPILFSVYASLHPASRCPHSSMPFSLSWLVLKSNSSQVDEYISLILLNLRFCLLFII